jgi:hypothetical protein
MNKNNGLIHRRDAIKRLTMLWAFALTPLSSLLFSDQKNPLHFVGLGSAGKLQIEYASKMGVRADYTFICGPNKWGIKMPNHFKELPLKKPNFINQNDSNHYQIVNDFKEHMKLTEEIKELFSKNQKYILAVGLGGVCGTSLALNLAEFLLKEKKEYLLICSLPFIIEGSNRRGIALEAFVKLSKYESCRFLDHNELLLEYPDLRFSEAFEVGNKKFYQEFIKYQTWINQKLPKKFL